MFEQEKIALDVPTRGSITREAERDLAQLLAEYLRDDPFWTAYEAPPDDAAWRDAMAERALALYDATARLLEVRSFRPAEPIDRAIAAIREIADGCAILSQPWSKERSSERSIASRALLESGIRAYGIDAWTAGLGIVLTSTATTDSTKRGRLLTKHDATTPAHSAWLNRLRTTPGHTRWCSRHAGMKQVGGRS